MDELYSLATSQARKLARKWRVDYEDIRQEILVAALQEDLSWLQDEGLGEEERRDLMRQLRVWAWYVGERFCRREKAARSGYQVEDEVYYSRARLQELLSWYLECGLEERPPVSYGESVARAGDPSEGGNHLAALLDVERGLSLLQPSYRERLTVRFGPLEGLSDDAIASLPQSEVKRLTGWHHERLGRVLGVTGDQVRHRVDTALRALQSALGGANPWNRGPAPRSSHQTGLGVSS